MSALTPNLTTLTDVVAINPDSAGMTIGSTGNTTLNWGSNAKVQWRSTSDGGAVNQWVFDNTGQNIFTGMHWRTDANKKIFRFDAVASGGVDPGDGSHQTNFVLSGVDNVFKSRQHNETKTGLLFDASDIDLVTDTGVSINGNFTFPIVDGTVDQQLTTDGSGNVSWGETHVVSDTTTGTYAPPKMLNRSGDSAAFDFVTDDQTYAGAYSARLGLISWANLASNNVAVATFKSTNDKSLFQLAATGSADDGSHDMDFKLRGATGYLSTRDNSSAGGALTDMTIEGTNLLLKSPIINFNDNFTFPNVDGTVNQVMSTDGAGNLSWVTASGGGGGATALSDLTDVSELNLQNNDLLMYNSTASEWQNTNLGVSVTPTLTGDASTLKNQSYTFTVSNHATYDAPAYFVGLYDGSGNLIRNNNDFTDNGDGTITGDMIAPVGTYELRVKCQDFGDLQSEIATKALTLVQFGDSFRYWKLTGVTCANGNWWMLANMRLFDAASQSGTSYPGNMTSATTPSPYVIDTSNNYNATYPAWKALDANTTTSFYWTIGSSNGPADWITIDLGSTIDVKSMTITAGNSSSYAPKGFELYGSATGVFGGEETLVHTASNLPAVSGQVTNIG